MMVDRIGTIFFLFACNCWSCTYFFELEDKETNLGDVLAL